MEVTVHTPGDLEAVKNQKAGWTMVRKYKKVGRNDLCPCGSGKKYKHCHGRRN